MSTTNKILITSIISGRNFRKIRARKVASLSSGVVTSHHWANHRSHFHLSKQLLCPCRIDLEWRCQVGSAVSCQQGIQAFLTGAHHMAPVPLQGPDPPSSRTHVVWPAAISPEAAHIWPQKLILTACDSVCIHADEVYDLVCSCGMTEGPHTGEPFIP